MIETRRVFYALHSSCSGRSSRSKTELKDGFEASDGRETGCGSNRRPRAAAFRSFPVPSEGIFTQSSSVAWAVSAHPPPDRPIRTTLQKRGTG